MHDCMKLSRINPSSMLLYLYIANSNASSHLKYFSQSSLLFRIILVSLNERVVISSHDLNNNNNGCSFYLQSHKKNLFLIKK